MITKVVHGWHPGGLIRYLLGPGRAQEHTNPRVIAAWDGRDTAWQPVRGSAGRLVLGPLITALEAPAIAAGLPTTRSGSGRRGYVWHCSARVAATDRPLSDGEWSGIARELLAFTGQLVMEPSAIRLNELIGGMRPELERIVGPDIRIVLELDQTLEPVMADPAQVRQIILKLAANSRDAMEQGGTLRIATSAAAASGRRSSSSSGARPS